MMPLNETIRELEGFDPLRGIIPGVARKEIDFISAVDLAIYSDSTDENVTPSENNSWGEAEVEQFGGILELLSISTTNKVMMNIRDNIGENKHKDHVLTFGNGQKVQFLRKIGQKKLKQNH